MSVLIQLPSGQYVLYSKGADSKIMSRLDTDALVNSISVVEDTVAEVMEWGQDGLRTLMFAYRELEAGMVHEWLVRFKAASANLQQRLNRDSYLPNDIDAAMDDMESQLVLSVSGAVCGCVGTYWRHCCPHVCLSRAPQLTRMSWAPVSLTPLPHLLRLESSCGCSRATSSRLQ